MITTVAASVALAMGAVLASDENPARLCSSNLASNPACCTINVSLLGSVTMGACDPREFSLQLRIKGDRLSTLPYLQPIPYLKISPTS